MEVITPGHRYVAKGFETEKGNQTIQFIEKKPIEEGSVLLKTENDGTTNEDVLEILINRMKFLQNKFPCRENAIVITKLEESLMWLEKRTQGRIDRGVEGKNEE